MPLAPLAAAMPPTQSVADDAPALMQAVARGDRRAAEALVDQIEPVVTRVVHRLAGWSDETEDLVQNTFLEIHKACPSFRGDSRLETWATAIAVNCCRRWARKRRRSPRLFAPPDDSPDRLDEQPDKSEPGRQHDAHDAIRWALAKLRHADREVIVLRRLEELSIDQISLLLGKRPNAVEVSLHRAEKRLAALLTEELAD